SPASSRSTPPSPLTLDVSVCNKYQTTASGEGQPQQKSMYPWEHIAEPYADTKLEVANFHGEGDGGLTFRWEMDDGFVLGFGASITTSFRTPGLFN
ncbi:unnamed protein product, partial [Laminaria digitata]